MPSERAGHGGEQMRWVLVGLLLALAPAAAWGDQVLADEGDDDDSAAGDDDDSAAGDEDSAGDDDDSAAGDEDSPTGDDSAAGVPEPDEPTPAPPVPVVPEIPGLDLPPLPPLPADGGAAAGTIIPSAPVALPPPIDVKLGGFVAFDWQPYLLAEEGFVDAVAQVRVAPRLEAKFQFVRAIAEIEYRHDFLDAGRNRLIVREALAGLRWKGLRVEAGALLPRWGKMDVASPTDNVVAQDYEDLFFPEALPVPGILVGYGRGPVSFEAILLPAFRPSRFRGGSISRWDIARFLPQTQEVQGPFEVLTLENQYNSFVDPVLDGDAELGRGIEVGGRVDLALPVLDIGVSFLATRDRLPTYTAYRTRNIGDGDGDGQPDVLTDRFADLEVTPHHRRIYVPGVDLAAALGPVVLKGEAAFFATEDPSRTSCLVDDPYVKYAFGAELVLSNLVGDFDLAVRAQYNGDVALPATDKDGPNRFGDVQFNYPDGGDQGNYERGCRAETFPADQEEPSLLDPSTGFTGTPEQRHPYSHGFFWNVNLGFTRNLSLDLRGFVDTAGDALLIPRFQLLLLDRLSLSVGGLVMLATGDDTIFTAYGRNHRVELGVRYDF